MATYIDRLMACGFPEGLALEICGKYADKGRWTALETFVRCNELFNDDRKQYPSER
jgi:hypothetical protein